MPAAFIGGGAAICILLLILFFQDVHRSSLHSQVADPLSHADYDKVRSSALVQCFFNESLVDSP